MPGGNGDQRREPRVNVDLPVRLHAPSGEPLAGRAGNLSREGVFVALPHVAGAPRTEVRELQVEIELPDVSAPLTALGEVRWVDGSHPGLGIRFTRMNESDRARLANFVLALAPHKHEL